MFSSGCACTRKSIPTAASSMTSTIWPLSTRPCISMRTPRHASGRRSWSAARTSTPLRCAASRPRMADRCPKTIKRSAISGEMKAPPRACGTLRMKCASNWANRTGFAKDSYARAHGKPTSPRRSPTLACRPSWPCCLTWSRPSIPRPTPRSAPPACGSSCARPAGAICASTMRSTIASTPSVPRKRRRSFFPTTTGCWVRGRWR